MGLIDVEFVVGVAVVVAVVVALSGISSPGGAAERGRSPSGLMSCKESNEVKL